MFLMIYYNGYGYNFYYGNYGYYEYSQHPDEPEQLNLLVFFLVTAGSFCVLCSPCMYIRCKAFVTGKSEEDTFFDMLNGESESNLE